MKLPQNAKFIISRLNAHGHRADAVGGCVRDFLLGVTPYDYDITTDASPDELREVFSDVRTADTGIKHGTLTVVLDGEPYEVTTYRIDGEYTDNRHPDSVIFTKKLRDDLSRRDFTVNAMCYNDVDGFTDLFGGREDLDAGIIRAVGEAEKRFTEDALRILRALRFASTLDFTIEKGTADALFKCAPLLKNISAERILVEWRKLIAGVGAYRILSDFGDVIRVVIPEISSPSEIDENLFAKASGISRELALFAYSGGASAYESAMERLKSDNRHKKLGTAVLCHIERAIETDTDIKKLLMNIGKEAARELMDLKILLNCSTPKAKERLDGMLKKGVCFKISDLAVNGNDLIALGVVGKDVGRILGELLLAVVESRIENDRDTLLREVARLR